jgi:arginyl-tRNA synthetase
MTATNLFDHFELALRGERRTAPWAARAPRRPQASYDVKLVPRLPEWRSDSSSARALAELQREPWVDSIHERADGVRLRLSDAWIERAGADLEAGGSSEGRLDDLAAGGRYSIQFWDANATKALHVGHLRNLSIGNALAAALAQGGAHVERRSLISDAGRSMGEAMAGVVDSGLQDQAWPNGDRKSDHFVGLCYADYVAAGNMRVAEQAEDSLTRELELADDAADGLLKRVLGGDPDALELWFKTRAWVIAGQRKTLARLGISFDRVFFESDFLADAARLTADGLSKGFLRTRPDGVVVFDTGLSELRELPLVRADGLTTQHLRAVAYWTSAPEMEELTTLQICGSEWTAHAACIRRLMSSLGNGRRADPHPRRDIFHGMVAGQKRAVMSSSDGALLIDELLDWLEQRIEADTEGRALLDSHPARERLGAQVLLGYFLPQPASPAVEFEPERLLRGGESVGWDLVRARARSGRGAAHGASPASDVDYRFAVVQSELYRRYLRLAVERFDVRPIAHYLKHLAGWYLERERTSRVERVVHTLLDRGARGLGLEPGR